MTDVDEEKPIVSLLADDPIERPRIEVFVLGLSDTIDALQDLEQAGDLTRIRASAEALGQSAQNHGFPPLAEAAAAAIAAAQDADGKRTREALIALTEVARRIRLGHRGAAPPGF